MNTDYLKPSEIVNLLPAIDSIHKVHNFLSRQNIDVVKDNNRVRIPPSSMRKILHEKGFEFRPTIYSFHIVKGGVGKTTFASTFAYRASQYGARVLAIDLDQQGNLTSSLGVNGRGKPVMIDIIKGQVDITEAIVPINDNLFVLPSNMNNSRLDNELSSSNKNISTLFNDLIEPIRDDIDYVVFDCPPTLNKITTAASLCSDLVVMPINADVFSMDALDQTEKELADLGKSYKKNIEYKLVWNKYDNREKLCIQYLRDLAQSEKYSKRVSLSLVRTDTNIKNALYNDLPIFSLETKSSSKEDFDNLTRELMGITEWILSIKNDSRSAQH
jgi:chromosome partitioning protein